MIDLKTLLLNADVLATTTELAANPKVKAALEQCLEEVEFAKAKWVTHSPRSG